MLNLSGQACLQRLWHWEPHLQYKGSGTCPSSWSCTSRRSSPLHHFCPSWGEESGSKERRIWGVWCWHGLWSFWLNLFCYMFNKKLNSLKQNKTKKDCGEIPGFVRPLGVGKEMIRARLQIYAGNSWEVKTYSRVHFVSEEHVLISGDICVTLD